MINSLYSAFNFAMPQPPIEVFGIVKLFADLFEVYQAFRHSFGSKHVIGIVIEDIDNMYFPDGNSLGIYGNEKENKVIYLLDIASDPIEFLIEYKEK